MNGEKGTEGEPGRPTSRRSGLAAEVRVWYRGYDTNLLGCTQDSLKTNSANCVGRTNMVHAIRTMTNDASFCLRLASTQYVRYASQRKNWVSQCRHWRIGKLASRRWEMVFGQLCIWIRDVVLVDLCYCAKDVPNEVKPRRTFKDQSPDTG